MMVGGLVGGWLWLGEGMGRWGGWGCVGFVGIGMGDGRWDVGCGLVVSLPVAVVLIEGSGLCK